MINLHTHVAMLIDADNVDILKYAQNILKISEYYGELETCLAYRDWKQFTPSKLKKIDALNIERIQVDNMGLNATDHGLLLGAGEILGADYYGKDVRFFILVSGDGGFTSACQLIRERGKQVIVIGNRKHTADSLRAACDKFYCLEDLDKELTKLKKLHPIPPNEVRRFFHLLFQAYYQFADKEYIWVSYSELEAKLHEMVHGWPDEKNLFVKYPLFQWLRNFDKDFEISEKEQLIRKIDSDLEYVRYSELLRAYLDTKGPDDLAPLDQFDKAVRLRPNYQYRFGSKEPAEWLKDYPERFETRDNHVFYNKNWIIDLLN